MNPFPVSAGMHGSRGNGNAKCLILCDFPFPFPTFPTKSGRIQAIEFITIPAFPVITPTT